VWFFKFFAKIRKKSEQRKPSTKLNTKKIEVENLRPLQKINALQQSGACEVVGSHHREYAGNTYCHWAVPALAILIFADIITKTSGEGCLFGLS
jgi:hypothetical protein